MSDNNKYDTMPFPFDSPSPLPIESDGLKVGLRDYFASQALAGLLANPELATDAEFTAKWSCVAKWSYLNADAMLTERQKERE